MKRMALLFLCAFVLAAGGTSFGEDPSDGEKEPSVEELARELANPNAPLASLTFKNQYRLFTGDLPHAGGQIDYYIERNDAFAPKWNFSFNITPVVPNVFAKWLGLM